MSTAIDNREKTVTADKQAAANAQAPRRARRPAEETREDILNTAENLFRAHGYASVAIADIASELSMSPASVFKHFRTKTSLVDAIATRAIEEKIRQLNELDREKPARDRLYELARHLMDDHVADQKDAPFVFEMIQVTIREELDCGDRFREMLVESIAEIIRSGVRDGDYHVDDVYRYAGSAFSALICVIHPVMIGMEKADILATRCEDVVNLIDVALRSPLAK